MKTIALTQGQMALVSDKDYHRLQKHKWFAHRDRHAKTYYAVRSCRGPDGKPKRMAMHTEILGRLYVDHKNGNGLDNRRSNYGEPLALKICTTKELEATTHQAGKVSTGMRHQIAGWHALA
jgi:hypothetical protein